MKNIRYIAFLRGVNVKGTNMKMTEVCAVFEKVGLKSVNAVLASGNIIFTSEISKEKLKIILEKALSEHFSYEAFLFIKMQSELEDLVKNNPFEKNENFHIYGFIGVENLATILMEEYGKSKVILAERGEVIQDNFYWNVPKGDTLGSEFGKILGNKKLKNSFTSRNINTLEKILNKMK